MITTVFDPPLPSDPLEVFNAKSFDTASKYNSFASEINATATQANVDAATATSAAGAATAKAAAAAASEAAALANAQAAAASIGAQRWISGKLYEDGDVVWGPAKGRIYRRLGDGAGVLDPSIDEPHWLLLSPIDDPTALAITYDAQGRPQIIEETVGANLRQTTSTYNADGTVATVVIVFGGVTRTETYSYTSGRLTGMTATEA